MSQRLNDKITFLIEEYQLPLVRYTTAILKDHEQARDVVQDAFIKLIQAMRGKKEIRNEKSWLYKVCHNLALDYLRKKKKRYEKKEQVLTFTAPGAEQPPDKQLNSKEENKLVRASISRLNERERQILNLKIKDDLSYREIAKKLDLTVSNVGFILHKTMKKLALIFKETDEQEVRR